MFNGGKLFMVIISYTGLDLYLVGELNAKIHNKVSKILGIPDEDIVFTSFDSFVYYKGHEQTSINLMIKVEMDEALHIHQEALAKLLMETSKEYSLHSFVYFSYFKEENTYLSINEDYPRYLTGENEKGEDDYDEEKDYNDEDIYTGNIFENTALDEDEDKEPEVEDEGPISFNSLFHKN